MTLGIPASLPDLAELITYGEITVGVQKALHEDYLEYRIASTAYLGNHIAEQGVPIVQPPGGHAVYIDARVFLPHIPPDHFPGVALANELYLEGGIRSVEIGTLMFGAAAKISSALAYSICSLPRFFRPIDELQFLNTGKCMIVGDEDRVQRKSVSADHGIEVSHWLALAF
jgi:tryptophanase